MILAAVLMATIPLIGEVGLRASRMHFEPQLYAPDRARGWVLRAGVGGVVAGEDTQYVRINSHGFRDRERSYSKPLNTVRIAVLGNSWTEALQVPLEKTYCSVVERLLTRSPCFAGKNVEVLNFGVAGYSTGQELLTLQQEVWKYQPDMVLLAFYPARDIANNIRELNNAANPEQSPYFTYRGDHLVLDDTFRSLPALQPGEISLENRRYQMSRHVRLLQALNELQRAAKIRLAMAAARDRAERFGVENLEYAIYTPPAGQEMQRAWKVTEGLLLAMRDEVKANGAEFRVVIQATRPQVIPDAVKRAELMRKLGVADFNYVDRRMSDFGGRAGISVTTLAPALSSYAETHHVYLNGFNGSNLGAGHWNETGHRVAAETIAADLCKAAEGRAEAASTTVP